MKKGFTLIELLAVIVILAIIAVIATPLILSVIDDAKKGAFKNSVYGIIDAIELKYAQDTLKGSAEEIIYIYDEGRQISPYDILNVKGQKPQKGEIKVNNKGEIALFLFDGKYCAEKSFDNSTITVTEKTELECAFPILPDEEQICPSNLIDSRDEEEYLIVQIGNQCWMAENLRYTGNGCLENDLDNENYNACRDNSLSVLYQWGIAQTVCPDGSHLPSDDEWKDLEGYVDSQYEVGDSIWDEIEYRGYDVGTKLKTSNNWNGADEYGFNAFPAGSLNPDGSYFYEPEAYFWTSTVSNPDNAWYRTLSYYFTNVYRNAELKANGYSVRCLLNQ